MWKFLAQVCGKLKSGDLVLSARAQARPLSATHPYSGSTEWGWGGAREQQRLLDAVTQAVHELFRVCLVVGDTGVGLGVQGGASFIPKFY